MQTYTIIGPDGPTVGMEAVRALLGGVSEDTVNRMVSEGRFLRPIRAGAKSPQQWNSVAVACWLAIAPMMYPDIGGADGEDDGGRTSRK